MKVGKEAIAGLMVALQIYDQRTDDSLKQFERMQWLVRQFHDVPGVQCAVVTDEESTAAYQAQLTFDQKVIGLSCNEIIQQLKIGTPAIYTRSHYADLGIIIIDPRPLLEGQEQIIADRMTDVIAGN
jgi:seryl-tRNA(Sec) selenium transferase